MQHMNEQSNKDIEIVKKSHRNSGNEKPYESKQKRKLS
jgi:hypothetical protein